MRRFILCVSLLLASFICVCASDQVFAQYGNTLFSETGFDFKGIPRYTMPKHSFIFQNNSDDELHLIAARTSCQCTKVFIPEKRAYQKGEKGEVVAQIDAVRFTGDRHATVTVTFERSGRTFEVALNIVGVVLENVRVEPDKLNFVVDEIKPGAAVTNANRSQQAVVVYPTNESVVRADSSSPYVDVKIGRPVRTNVGLQTPLTVSVKDDAPAGYINSVVRLWSNGSYSSIPLTLNVSGSVRAQLSVSPSTLTFYKSEDGKKIVKNVVVSASSVFTLKKIQSDSEAIECNISPKIIRPARVCVVPISFDPSKLRNESSMAKVRIETTDGRTIVLNAQISSGNFEIAGVTQTDLNVEVEEFDESEDSTAQQDRLVEIPTTSAAVEEKVETVPAPAQAENKLRQNQQRQQVPQTQQQQRYQRPAYPNRQSGLGPLGFF